MGPTTREPDSLARSLLAVSILFISLCSCSSANNPNRHRFDEPSPYYLYTPQDYSPDRARPLFIGVNDLSTDGKTCWDTWQRYADEKGFVLLCPELADADGQLSQANANDRLLKIVDSLYGEYTLEAKIFLVGFSEGAQFVHGYAFANPNYVVGVSVIAAGNYFRPPAELSYIPFEVIVGERDNPIAVEHAQELAGLLDSEGYRVGLHILPGVGHEINKDAIQITLDMYDRVVGPR
jgi:predicted esterase